MKYLISEEAENDLENIWFYTFQNWSIQRADEYLNLIFHRIKIISNDPTVGDNYSQIRKGYFRFKAGSHYIFYKTEEENSVVKIIRILHERMNIEARLNE